MLAPAPVSILSLPTSDSPEIIFFLYYEALLLVFAIFCLFSWLNSPAIDGRLTNTRMLWCLSSLGSLGRERRRLPARLQRPAMPHGEPRWEYMTDKLKTTLFPSNEDILRLTRIAN